MENLVQLVGTGGIAVVVTAIIAAIAGRRVQRANAGNLAMQSADTQIENLQNDNKELRQRVRDAEERESIAQGLRELAQTKVREWWARADRHAAWDRRQEARLAEQGIDDPMPPLYPTRDEVASKP